MASHEAIFAALKWVDEVLPEPLPQGGCCVEMTWEEYNAMRALIGLEPRKPRTYRGRRSKQAVCSHCNATPCRCFNPEVMEE